MPDKKDALEAFARALVEIRDTAIAACATPFSEAARGGTVAERWRAALSGVDVDALQRSFIPDVVDSVIFELLIAIENEEIELFIRHPGKNKMLALAELGDGEMAGEYIGDDGWREAYSSHPVNPV